MITVFDLISGLFAYVILGKKTPYLANPPELFFVGKYCKGALCNLLVCVYPGCKTLREGRKEMIDTVQYNTFSLGDHH